MKRLLSFTLALLISASTIFTVPASALSDTLLKFFDKNGIYYYNPDGYSDGCYIGLGSYDGIASAGLSALQSSFVDTYHTIAIQLSTEYGIPWEAVVAQGIVESASGTSRFARERYNFFGLGAVDSDPDQAYTYSSPQEGWRGYYKFISENPRYRSAGAFNYPNDPYSYIVAIKNAGYATSPTYVETISRVIKAVQNRADEKGWSTSDVTSASASLLFGTYHACNTAAYGNGDINATALSLSWSDRSHGLYDTKPEYRTALESVGLSTYPDNFVKVGASCDAFVATVLRFSGVDSNVSCCGAVNMLRYFASHPDLYEEIPNTGNTSNLQAGDIRVSPKHVEMYVIDESGNGKIASASYSERTSDHFGTFYPDSSYRIFRFKGASL